MAMFSSASAIYPLPHGWKLSKSVKGVQCAQLVIENLPSFTVVVVVVGTCGMCCSCVVAVAAVGRHILLTDAGIA